MFFLLNIQVIAERLCPQNTLPGHLIWRCPLHSTIILYLIIASFVFLIAFITIWNYFRCGPLEKRMWSTGKGNVVHWRREWQTTSVFLPWEPHEQHEKAKRRTLKEELPRSVGAQYATVDQWRNNSRKNEGMEPKQNQHPVVDVTGDRSKVWCCKEQYCIGTWNVRSMNQGKLEVVKQEMTRVNIDILGIS